MKPKSKPGPKRLIVMLRVPFTLRRLDPSASWQSSEEVLASAEVRQLFAALAQAAAPDAEPKRFDRNLWAECYRCYGFELRTCIIEDVTASESAGISFYGLWDWPGQFPAQTVEGNVLFSLVCQSSERTRRFGWFVLIVLTWVGLPALGIDKLNDAVLHLTPRLLMAVTILLSIFGMTASLVVVDKFLARRNPPNPQLSPLAEAYMNPAEPGISEFRKFADGVFRVLRTASEVSVGDVTIETEIPFAARPTWLAGIDAELRPFGARASTPISSRRTCSRPVR